MLRDYLHPISADVYNELIHYTTNCLGTEISIHSSDNFPKVNKNDIVLITVSEDRDAVGNLGTGSQFSEFRKEFYKLFKGNWHKNIVDLGIVYKGNETKDTHFAIKEMVSHLVKQNILPIIIGGSQSLTYSMYRAYDTLEQMVNLVAIDSKFDLEQVEKELHSRNYLTKIVMNEPTNLFNFCNIGYQTFYNAQEEIDLLDKLYFDKFRVGEVRRDLKNAEPICRDADLISIDLGSIRVSEAPANQAITPNGFYGEDICTLMRYAGLSDKVSSIGVFEYNEQFDIKNQTAKLLSQMIWYFIEGVNFRLNEYPFKSKEEYIKYIVPIDKDTFYFYKSNKSNRWWMEIKDNKFSKETLIPCTYNDYVEASNQQIPERWWKMTRKLT